MGRFATSLIAITVVLCTFPLEPLRLFGMQDADPKPVEISEPVNASGETSVSESPADSTADSASETPAQSGDPVKAGSDTPLNPAAPASPANLSNGGSGSASSNGNAVATAPVAAGSGDGSSPPPKGDINGSSIGPGGISVEVSDAPDGAFKKDPSFSELFFANPLNLILFVFIALYVLLLFLPKPGAKDKKAQQQRLASLKKNDRVVLTSGIHGIVTNINTEAGTVTVRVDENSNAKIIVDRSAIRSVGA